MLRAGTTLGPYEIIAPLGAGGMGEVYRARDPKLGRAVALRLLPATFTTDPERLARFRRGVYSDVYGEKKLTVAREGVLWCGYVSCVILCASVGGRLKKIWLAD